MRLLIVNDDGPRSPGLHALLREFRGDNELFIAVPAEEHSGASHSVSFFSPLTEECTHFDTENCDVHIVRGTPADCTIWALSQLLPDRRPDLVLSGINKGFNTADSTYYSGTLAAAFEAFAVGLPTIAISGPFVNYDYSIAARVLKKLLPAILQANAGRPFFYSINVPGCAENEIAGVMNAPVSRNKLPLTLEKRLDPFGRDYYWHTSFEEAPPAPEKYSDLWAIRHNYVSVTPIKIDYTDYETLRTMPDLSNALK